MDDATTAALLRSTRRHLRTALVFLFVGPIVGMLAGMWALLGVADTAGLPVGIAFGLAIGACAGIPGIVAGRRALGAVRTVAAGLGAGAPPYREAAEGAATPAARGALEKARGQARWTLGLGVVAALVGAVGPLAGLLLFVAGMGAPGRPFRRRGRAALPRTLSNGAWCEAVPRVAELGPEERAARARRWLEDARGEHASIAAFCDVTLDLLALGAPPALVEQSLRAALDEVTHARRAFEMASAYAGRPLSAGDLPEAAAGDVARRLRVAAASLVDGALHEGHAAARAAAEAAAADSEAERDVLRGIAADEARHAALGRSIAAWVLDGA